MSFNILDFFTKVENSIKGYINLEELVKTVVTALGAGTTVLGVLEALQTHLGAIITDPNLLSEIQAAISGGVSKNWVALTIAVATLAADLYRRFNQGVTPIVPVVPTPAPAPAPSPNVKNW